MIYFASPYSDPSPIVREHRFELARHKVVELLRAGHVVFSPIVYCHEMALAYDLGTDSKFWETFNRDIITCCDSMMVYKIDGWDKSIGVAGEIKLAMNFAIPIIYLEE